MKPSKLIKVCTAAALFVSALAFTVAAQQPETARTYVLEKIEMVGVKSLKLDALVQATELVVGQKVDRDVLDGAAAKLVATGLLRSVGYRFRTTGGNGTVTFTVEESPVRIPVVFDNFVWFTDDELYLQLRKDNPAFDGTLSDTGDVGQGVKRSLERMLAAKGFRATVEVMPEANAATGKMIAFRYSVLGADLKICELHFPGAVDIAEATLVSNSKHLFDDEYSRSFTTGFANATLLPLYYKSGHLKATFDRPLAKLIGDGDCKSKVLVEVPVKEGILYSFDSATWSGNSSKSNADLEKLLGFNHGDVADTLKLSKSLDEIQRAYGRIGFVTARARTKTDFDDDHKLAVFQIQITEGTQYKMGKLTITGLPAEGIEIIERAWMLAPGAVYDDMYASELMDKLLRNSARLVDMLKALKDKAYDAPTERVPQQATINLTLAFH